MERLLLDFTTYLTANIADDATTLTVADTSGPSPSFRVRIDDEIILVTATDEGDWTITRAQEGTAPAAHLSGAAVAAVITPAGLNTIITQLIAARAPQHCLVAQGPGDSQTIDGGTDTNVSYPYVVSDPHEAWDEDTRTFTAPVAGVYVIFATVTITDPQPDATHYLSIYNHTDPAGSANCAVLMSGAGEDSVQTAGLFFLAANDEITATLLYIGDFTQEHTADYSALTTFQAVWFPTAT